jgi:hypothetical protein
MGLIGKTMDGLRCREQAPGHVYWLFCSVTAVLEEPSTMPEGKVRVLNEPVRGTSAVEEAEGRGGGCS